MAPKQTNNTITKRVIPVSKVQKKSSLTEQRNFYAGLLEEINYPAPTANQDFGAALVAEVARLDAKIKSGVTEGRHRYFGSAALRLGKPILTGKQVECHRGYPICEVSECRTLAEHIVDQEYKCSQHANKVMCDYPYSVCGNEATTTVCMRGAFGTRKMCKICFADYRQRTAAK